MLQELLSTLTLGPAVSAAGILKAGTSGDGQVNRTIKTSPIQVFCPDSGGTYYPVGRFISGLFLIVVEALGSGEYGCREYMC